MQSPFSAVQKEPSGHSALAAHALGPAPSAGSVAGWDADAARVEVETDGWDVGSDFCFEEHAKLTATRGMIIHRIDTPSVYRTRCRVASRGGLGHQ